MGVTNTENLLFMEFEGNTEKYMEWKGKSPDWIDTFCQVVEQRDISGFDRWLAELDVNREKIDDYFLGRRLNCTLIRAEWEEGFDKFLQAYDGHFFIEEFKCCQENRWLNGVLILCKYETLWSKEVIEHYIEEAWLEGFVAVLKMQKKLAYGVCSGVVREKWIDGAKVLYIMREDAREQLAYHVITLKWMEGIKLLLDYGANGYALLGTATFHKWAEGVDCILQSEKIQFDSSVHNVEYQGYSMSDILKLAVANDRYDWLDILLPWNVTDVQDILDMDLSECVTIENLEKVLVILDKHNLQKVKSRLLTKSLHESCEKKNLELVRYFVENGANVNAYGKFFYLTGYMNVTPLHIAAHLADYEMVQYLVNKGATVDARIYADNTSPEFQVCNGVTPLGFLWSKFDYQTYDEMLKVTRLLIEEGAQTTGIIYNSDGHPERNVTILGSMIDCYQMLDTWKILQDDKKKEKLFTIIESICAKDKEIGNRYYGWCKIEEEWLWKPMVPVIHLVDCTRYPELLELLLKYGYDVNTVDEDGLTVLHKYAYECFDTDGEKIIKILLNNGADINRKDKKGRTPLLYMLLTKKNEYSSYIISKVIDAYQQLVELGADDTIEDSEGNQPQVLLEEYRKEYIDARESEDAFEQAEIEAYEKREAEGGYRRDSLEQIYERNNYDEDSVKSDPDYWDYMYSKW